MTSGVQSFYCITHEMRTRSVKLCTTYFPRESQCLDSTNLPKTGNTGKASPKHTWTSWTCKRVQTVAHDVSSISAWESARNAATSWLFCGTLVLLLWRTWLLLFHPRCSAHLCFECWLVLFGLHLKQIHNKLVFKRFQGFRIVSTCLSQKDQLQCIYIVISPLNQTEEWEEPEDKLA